MNTPTKLGAFGVGLAAIFAAATGVGSLVGPVGPTAETGASGAHGDQHTGTTGAAHAADTPPGEPIPGGLMVSQDGYTLALAQDTAAAGDQVPLAFRILDDDGEPVTEYEPTHSEELHLIAVRRDLTGFQHVHPDLAADGTWSTRLDLTAGDWRVFADVAPSGRGEALTLGADLSVPGDYAPQPLPTSATTDEVDGYTVALEGRLVPGTDSELTLSVSRDGRPVTDLQPYLGAYGHLVALRDGDLAYLHVHPTGEPGDGTTDPGPDITFSAAVPTTGAYRVFLDFRHGDVVRTAEFTVTTDETAPADGTVAPAAPTTAPEHGADDHDH